MLILDLNTGYFLKPDTEHQDNNYPDEVLDSEWNPALIEIQSVQPTVQTPSKPTPQIVEASLARFYKNRLDY